MTMPRYLVFLDAETGGTEDEHPIVQLAVAAVDAITGEKIASAWWPLEYDPAKVTPKAREIWGEHETGWGAKVAPAIVVQHLTNFLQRWACVPKVSKRTGRTYGVAQLVCHNAKFDARKIELLYKEYDAFCPATIYQALCTLELARWLLPELSSHSLEALCEHFGIGQDAVGYAAHDARGDVNATIELWKCLRGKIIPLRLGAP